MTVILKDGRSSKAGMPQRRAKHSQQRGGKIGDATRRRDLEPPHLALRFREIKQHAIK